MIHIMHQRFTSWFRRSLPRSSVSILMIGVLAAIPWTHAGSEDSRAAFKVEFAKRQMILLRSMNGGPIRVAPSPAVCLDGEIPESYRDKIQEWWLGKGNCERTYIPNIESVVSPATSGIIRQFFPDKKSVMQDTLAALTTEMESPSVSVVKKLEIQSTAWELLAGIYLNLDDSSPAREQLVQLKSRANALLCSALLSEREIQALPDNLGFFISGYKPEILDRILRHDPDVLEIDHSGGLHREFSRYRFSTRVFITVDQKDQSRLREMLAASPEVEMVGFSGAKEKTPAPSGLSYDLRRLGDYFDGLHAVLVLYFNVFDENLRPVPTNLVAGWQEYKINGRMDQSRPAIENISKIRFTSIEYQRNFDSEGTPPFGYRTLDDHAISNPASVFETSPVFPDVPITTHRGKCLGCHTDAIGSFFTMRSMKVTLTPPLFKAVATVGEERQFKKFRNFLGGCNVGTSTKTGARGKAQRRAND